MQENNAPMMLGGGVDRPTHSVERRNYRRSNRFNAQIADYKVTLKNLEGRTYQDVCASFEGILKKVIDDVLAGSKPEDMVRFNVHSDNFNHGDINTPFQRRGQIAPDYVASIIDRTMQSNEDTDMDGDFILNVIHVDIPAGNGGIRMVDANMWINLIKRRCCITGMKDWFAGGQVHDGIHCFAYSLAIGLKLLTESYLTVRTWSRCRKKVIDRIALLHAAAGVPPGRVSSEHFQQFQNSLPDGVRLVIVDAVRSRGLLFKGSSGDKVIAIVYYNQHYLPLKNVATWFAVTYYCIDCEVGTNSKKGHICKKDVVCKKCKSRKCFNLPKLPRYCKQCKGMFVNPECLAEHRSNGVCERASNCVECGQWFSGDTPEHSCMLLVCSHCNKQHSNGDACFITPSTKSTKDKWKIIFYDFECYQEESQSDGGVKPHRVNYVVAMSYCNDCVDGFCDQCSQVHTFDGLNGEDALYNFCVWGLSHPANRKATFIAHNSSGYDAHFILDYLVRQGNTPELILQGGKILSMTIGNIRFIDSLSFLSMPLSDFSRTFDIPDKTKGTFPHLFNRPWNYDYDGPLPALEYYSPDTMKDEPRKRLLAWHAAHKDDRFVFADELKAYCIADVELLRAGCVKFRSNFIEATDVDPFAQITIASTCMEVFRRHHLKENSIGI